MLLPYQSDGSTNKNESGARYEFRCWPALEHEVVNRLDDHWVPGTEEARTDLYLISPRSLSYLAKLRGGERVEVKQLLDTYNGLERWRLALTSDFPLTDVTRHALAPCLGFSEPLSAQAALTPDSFKQSLQHSQAAIVLVSVTKQRRLFYRDGCRGEATRVTVDGNRLFTVGIEDADPERARRIVDELGLSAFPNVHYGRRLRSLLGEGQHT